MTAAEQGLLIAAIVLGLACLLSGAIAIWRTRKSVTSSFMSLAAITAGGACARLAQIYGENREAARAIQVGETLFALMFICFLLLIVTIPAALGRARAPQGYAR